MTSEDIKHQLNNNNTASKHARKHEARPPRIKREFRLDSNDSGFICDGVSYVDGYKTKRLIKSEWFVTYLLLLKQQRRPMA